MKFYGFVINGLKDHKLSRLGTAFYRSAILNFRKNKDYRLYWL